jgi:hypothetical protein
VDDATLLRHLAPLRAARVWLPDASVAAHATDLGIHRVMVTGGQGAVVEFRAGPEQAAGGRGMNLDSCKAMLRMPH